MNFNRSEFDIQKVVWHESFKHATNLYTWALQNSLYGLLLRGEGTINSESLV
jgi:hypothetical protein